MEELIYNVQVLEVNPIKLKLFIRCEDEDDVELWLGLNIGTETAVIKDIK